MKFFSIGILFIVLVLCNNNLHASHVSRKNLLEKKLAIERLEIKRELSSLWTHNNYNQVEKSKSALVVATTNNNNDNNKRKRPDTVRFKPKEPVLNLFDAIQSDLTYAQVEEWFLKDNSSVNQVNAEGYTPLQFIVLETIQLIISPEKHDSNLRKTIVHKTEVIKLLLNHGADTSITDSSGQTVKDKVITALEKTSKHTNPYRRLKRVKVAIKNIEAKKKLIATKGIISFEKSSPIVTTELITFLN